MFLQRNHYCIDVMLSLFSLLYVLLKNNKTNFSINPRKKLAFLMSQQYFALIPVPIDIINVTLKIPHKGMLCVT